MRALLAIVVLAALGWGGFWYWNASVRERALADWLEQRRAAGWVADAEVHVRGFPNRVDASVVDLDLANPAEGWAWSAPDFQILSQTWKPWQVIAVWPTNQTISTPLDAIAVTSRRMVASATFEPDPRLALDHSTVELRDVTLTGDAGWTAGLGTALLSVRQSPAAGVAPFTYDLDFRGERLDLPRGWMSRIAGSGLLPGTIDSGHLAAALTFDKAWNRAAIEGEPPRLRSASISEMRLTWGNLALSGSGTLTADPQGFARGRLDLSANDWRGMLDVAEQAGAIGEAAAGTLRSALELYSSLSGSRSGSLDMPLEFKDGMTMLGPVPIGPAPMLAGPN